MLKEVDSVECEEHQGRKKLYQHILLMGYYWPSINRDATEFVKTCHRCQVQIIWLIPIPKAYIAW